MIFVHANAKAYPDELVAELIIRIETEEMKKKKKTKKKKVWKGGELKNRETKEKERDEENIKGKEKGKDRSIAHGWWLSPVAYVNA